MTIFKKAESFQTCKAGEWAMWRGCVYGRSPNGCGAAFRLTGHVKTGADGKVVPDPARDWEIRADGTIHPSVNMTLPEDAAFHDFIKLGGWKA